MPRNHTSVLPKKLSPVEEEAQRRLLIDGPNVLAKDQRAGIVQLVLHAVMSSKFDRFIDPLSLSYPAGKVLAVET